MDSFHWPIDKPAWDISLIRTMDQRGEEAARLVTELTTRSRYDAVFMVGMCMGIKDRVKRGEVLVPREAFSLAHRRDTSSGDKGIPHALTPPTSSIKRMQSLLDDPKFTFEVHLKQTVCGPWKLENPDSARLHEVVNVSPDVYGYEMEAEGFFRAVRDRSFDALLVKGVSDFADAPGGSASGSQSKREDQIAATKNALDVVLAWLDHYTSVPPSQQA